MADRPDVGGSRRFNDREVAALIKRATELQQTEPVESERGGLSLGEIEQIAGEAGIDASLIRRAANELNQQPVPTKVSPFLGAPTHLLLERTIDGEVSEADLELFVDEIHGVLRQHGQGSNLGRSLSWSSLPRRRGNASARDVYVSVSPKRGVTTIRIEERLGSLAGALFGGIVGGFGGGMIGPAAAIGMGVFFSGAVAVGLAGLFATTAYVSARTIFSRMADRRARDLHHLMDRLEDLAVRSVETQSTISAGAPVSRTP